MKAFEKWESNGVCNIKIDCGNLHCLSACKKIKETVWRAACEHWLQVAKDHDQEIQFLIKKELKNE